MDLGHGAQYPNKAGRNSTTPGTNAITTVSANIRARYGQSGRATSAGSTPPTEHATSRLTPTGGRKTEIPWVATMTVP